jgi:phenylacetic acid degradation operon negative regulatory protein
MVRQGWLEPVSLPSGPGYRLTGRGTVRLQEAGARVYRVGPPQWDGRWHLLVLERVPSRASRERLRAGLAFLGYGPLAEATWLAPRQSGEVTALLAAEGIAADSFSATWVSTDGADAARLVRRAWDLAALGPAYASWLDTARAIVGTPRGADDEPDGRTAFAVRSELVHQWRKFLFTDPGLPRVLLPQSWPGDRAAEFFTSHAERLRPAADRFVDACLDGSP